MNYKDNNAYYDVGFGYALKPHNPSNVYQLSDINISGEGVFTAGNVVNLAVNKTFELTAKTDLPEGNYILILERLTDGHTVQGDTRITGTVSDGVAHAQGVISLSGNYMLRATRQNAGLKAAGMPFSVDFLTVDINAYAGAVS